MEVIIIKKTFHYQNSLPKMPVPSLKQTCDEFIKWAEPLLSPEQLARTKKIVEEFKGKDGHGPKLQRALIEFIEKNQLKNWTTPFYEGVYLKPRVPLIVEGNVFYLLNRKNTLEFSQSELAAQVILSALKFKDLIHRQELPVDMHRGEPLCMEQYKRFFSATRIPQKGKDKVTIDPSGKHILIFYKGHIFTMNVYNRSGQVKTYVEIKKQLEYILSWRDTKGQGIGIFTSMERDAWADIRKDILQLSSENEKNLEAIEKAIFAICLEDQEPDSMEEVSKMMLYGDGENRWFDKSLQLIITKNDYVGINMEHSGMDGSTIATLVQFIDKEIGSFTENKEEGCMEKPKHLTFNLNDKIQGKREEAKEQFYGVYFNNEIRVVDFDDFGIDGIKGLRVSPDAFIQLAFQLAQYKLFGRCYSQYEPTMARRFLHGRVEAMYAISNESVKFVKSMTSDSCSKEEKKKMLEKAAEKHIERIKTCQAGKGIDRHLKTLREMYNDYGKEMGIVNIPEIFTDEGYRILTHSTICTSSTSTNSPYGIQLAGWGPVVEDGFAIRYTKFRNKISFHVASRKHMEHKMDKLIEYIQESLIEMAELMSS